MKLIIKNIVYIILIISITIFLYIYIYYILDYKITNNIIDNRLINYPRKKVAFLLSGQIRENNNISLFSQIKNIIVPLNADVFCEFDDYLNDNDKQKIINILKPKKIEWNSYNVELKIKDNKYNNYKNGVIMYKRKYIYNKIKRKYEKENNFIYDIVIRCRPDLIIKEKIPLDIIQNIMPNTFYYPKIHKFDIFTNFFGKNNDQIYLCDSKTMDIITDINYDDLLYSIKCKYPEYILYHYIKKNIKHVSYIQKFMLTDYNIGFNNSKEKLKKINKFIYKLNFPIILLHCC